MAALSHMICVVVFHGLNEYVGQRAEEEKSLEL